MRIDRPRCFVHWLYVMVIWFVVKLWLYVSDSGLLVRMCNAARLLDLATKISSGICSTTR